MKTLTAMISLAALGLVAVGECQSFTATLQAKREASVFRVGDTYETTDQTRITFRENDEVSLGDKVVHLVKGQDYLIPISGELVVNGKTVKLKRKVYGAISLLSADWAGTYQTTSDGFFLGDTQVFGGLGAFEIGTFLGHSNMSVEFGADYFRGNKVDEESVKLRFLPVHDKEGSDYGIELGYITNSKNSASGFDIMGVWGSTEGAVTVQFGGGLYREEKGLQGGSQFDITSYITLGYQISGRLAFVGDFLYRVDTNPITSTSPNSSFGVFRYSAGLSYVF